MVFTSSHEPAITTLSLMYDVELFCLMLHLCIERLLFGGQEDLHVVTLLSPHHTDLH